MNRDIPNTDELLKRSWSSASREQIDVARHRVLQNLRSVDVGVRREPVTVVENNSRSRVRRIAAMSVAAALLLAVFVGAAIVSRRPAAVPIVKPRELMKVAPAAPLQPRAISQRPADTPPPKRLEFEVASIRPGIRGRITIDMIPSQIYRRMDNARVDLGSIDLKALILMAYRMTSNQSEQVVGPDWLAEERFDIAAKLPEGTTVEQVPEMMQALLAGRFRMQVHREQRRVPVFALVVGKPPLKLEEGSEDPTLFRGCNGGRGGHHECRNVTMKQVASQFSLMRVFDIDRPVVDKTDLKGAYNFDLDYGLVGQYLRETGAPLPTRPMEAPGFVSIADALKAVGLKLEERNEIFEFIVVDQIERTPTPN